MKKLMVTIITAVMILGASATSYGTDYSDVKSGNWSYEAVNAMSEKAIISGYPDGSFKPNNTVTTGEFIKMALIAATGKDVGNSTSGNWALNYYNKALELKYFTQYDIAKENLNKQITRAHMALIISSILGDVKIDNYDEIQKGITDITYKTPYEYDITKSYASGILTGYTDETFKPDKTLSRAEAATVIYRLVDESKRVIPSVGGVEQEQKPINEVITNLDSFYTENGSYDSALAKTETYSFADGSKYGLSLGENNGVKWITVPASVSSSFHSVYLMKDGKIVELTDRSADRAGNWYFGYKSDITTIDYIVSVNRSDKDALIISNPFKN